MTQDLTPPSWPQKFFGACAQMATADRRNLRRATWLLALWALVYVGAAYLLSREIVAPGPLAYAVAGVASAVAIVPVLAWAYFLRHADELQRKIQLEAMALAFGGGFVVSYALNLLERAGLPETDPTTPFLAMILCYLAGTLAAGRRYA